MFNFRRKEVPWEVVDNKFVDPSPTYYGNENLDITAVSEAEMRGTYVFDMKHKTGKSFNHELHRAVVFARQQLLREAGKKGFNILLIESWQLTILRKAKQHRIEVRYNGRPAHCAGNLPSTQSPPFVGILHA